MAPKVEVYCIYICGIGPDVKSDDLKFEFEAFGKIYGFQFDAKEGNALISYTHQKSAILAIANGNNVILGGLPIQVQWAKGWPKNRSPLFKDFHSVLNECQTNTTVHCSYLSNKTTINVLERMFCPFGNIQEIYTKQNCTEALVRFYRKVDATLAICTIDSIEVDGSVVCCKWWDRSVDKLSASVWQRTTYVKGYQVPLKPAVLPPSTNSTLRTSTTVSSATSNSTLRTPTEVSSATFAASVDLSTEDRTPAVSQLTSLGSRLSEIRILFSDTCNCQEKFLPLHTDIKKSSPALNLPSNTTATSTSISGNVTTTTPSTNTTFNFSGASSTLSNEQYISSDQQFQPLHTDIKKSNPAWNLPSNTTATSTSIYGNVTTTTPSTNATFNFSGASYTLSNEQYTNDDFDIVFNKAKLNNCTVKCEGLNLNITNETLKEVFSPFGIIEEIDLYADRIDYALIRFNTKVAATLAICRINNTKINGCRVKCTWSNKPADQNFQAPAAATDQQPVKTSIQLSSPKSCLDDKKDEPDVEESVKKITSNMLCKICKDEELMVVFLPCGHMIACEKCAQEIDTCPLCRKLITNKQRVYLG